MNLLSTDSRVLRNLKRLPLVDALDKNLWRELQPHIFVRQLQDGEVLFNTGTFTENLYVIVEGSLSLQFEFDNERELLELQQRHKGETAGDFALINGARHLVTAKAIGRTRLACFPREALELLTNIAPDILAYVYATASNLSQRVIMARVYCQLFGDIDAERLNALLSASELHHLETGETLFTESEAPDGLYVVIAGRLNVDTTDNNGKQVTLAVVHAGETIGEYALLTDSERYATVYATRESMVAKLPRETFDSQIMTEPALLASVTKIIVKRQLINVRGKIQQAADTNFVVIPLDERLPIRRLTIHIASAFKDSESPLVVDQKGFDTLYGKEGASQTSYVDPFSSSISAWMDDKENHYSHVLYIASPHWDAWTQRCINRADRILLVVSARQNNTDELRAIETKIYELYREARFKPRIELVLAHPPSTTHPSNTERWLKKRKIDAFHHVRISDRQHIQRLYRRITGKARGLVFSGGGARGYAHLGVQRAIEESNLEIDYIGGASMGGLLGAAMAMGKSYSDVFELSKTFANSDALFDYTLPMVSLMKSRKLTKFCHEVYGTSRIEDLWIPYFCVSSNLSNGQEVVHQRGDLWQAVRSTISLPGIFSPVPTIHGELLTDGSVLNNFPVDVMDRLLAGGSIIGVDVSQIGEIKQAYSYGSSISGWQVLMNRLNPLKDGVRVPRIIETLLRATDIKSFERIAETRELLDTLIVPEVADFPLLEFRKFPEISDIGYQAAMKVIPSIIEPPSDSEQSDQSGTQAAKPDPQHTDVNQVQSDQLKEDDTDTHTDKETQPQELPTDASPDKETTIVTQRSNNDDNDSLTDPVKAS